MRIHHLIALVSVALIGFAACAKEKKDSADPGTETTTTKTSPADNGIVAPDVAIGANRTEHLDAATTPVAETKEYAVSLALPDAVTAGAEATATVILKPQKGWKLNEEFPYSLKVEAPAGVKVAKASQDKSDAVRWEMKDSAHWAIRFTAESAGTKSFNGDFNFAVCTDATCNPYSQKLAFTVDVK